MQLIITAPRGIQFDGEAKSVNVKTTSGEITVLDHHLPLITMLAPSTVRIGMSEGGAQELEISGGFLEVDDNNQLTMLIQN